MKCSLVEPRLTPLRRSSDLVWSRIPLRSIHLATEYGGVAYTICIGVH